MKFIHHNPQIGSFNEQHCTSDQFLKHLDFRQFLCIIRWSPPTINIWDNNVISNCTYCSVKRIHLTNIADQIKKILM